MMNNYFELKKKIVLKCVGGKQPEMMICVMNIFRAHFNKK